jgi:PTH2 family peptidyl-tRNA hydrolase
MRCLWRTAQVLCVNDELKMGKGKIAAQCGHGVAGIFTKYRRKEPIAFQHWETHGGAKIALKVSSTKELVRLAA